MTWLRAFFLLCAACAPGTPVPAQDPIDSFTAALNRALGADANALRPMFAQDSEYRVGGRTVAAGPAEIAEALQPFPFSEATPSHLEIRDVFPLTSELTLVSARLVTYGSLILKQSRPVLVLVRQAATGWQVISLAVIDRMPFPAAPVRTRPPN